MHVAVERGLVVDDGHGPAAQHVAGAHHHREADPPRHFQGLVERGGAAVLRLEDPLLGEQVAEAAAVLGEVDGVRRGAPDGHAGRREAAGELERRLAAELDDHPFGLLAGEDRQHVLQGQGLEVEAVRGVVVGRHRLGVAVDHHRLNAQLAQGEGGVDAAVVELDPLADAVGAGAEDHHLAPRVRLALVLVPPG